MAIDEASVTCNFCELVDHLGRTDLGVVIGCDFTIVYVKSHL